MASEIETLKVGCIVGLKALGWSECDREKTEHVYKIIQEEFELAHNQYGANRIANAIYHRIKEFYGGEIPIVERQKN